VDRLGCWNCHGASGEGGGAGGPAVAKTRLPLRQFVKYLRVPAGSMPPISPVLATDSELATIYAWLGGVDAVRVPLPITVALKVVSPRPASVPAGGAGTEVDVTASRAQSNPAVEGLQDMSWRATVFAASNSPVANRAVECQTPGRKEWVSLTTGDGGEVWLGDKCGFALGTGRGVKEPRARLRLRVGLPAGTFVLIVEAIETGNGSPVVVGVGSAVLGAE